MVEFLELRGIEGATVLEIGGGVGEIQIELLKRGAVRSVNLELSSAYEEEATRLLREAELEGRAERRVHDIAVEPEIDGTTLKSRVRSNGALNGTSAKLPGCIEPDLERERAARETEDAIRDGVDIVYQTAMVSGGSAA
jgi:hypothetical protein